eukprot:CAMPEP_0194167040 /NCGR_PEP_ID=MMETSP0154-20130528/2462_1 /TAXON_ID=1049557 /ORGANISM="Thalassiothrix antarctica, Strain L6-D1" /LENGTH=397 /DNA_ID=CAMNT_0038877863 /DNA_START=35 /DNA_END=1228 /DNA_ORIENTATION=+
MMHSSSQVVLLLLISVIERSHAFSYLGITNSRRQTTTYHQHYNTKLYEQRQQSRVTDPDGPTPEEDDGQPEFIDPDDIPEMHYDEENRPIPHQPWRRGETLGCEDPIDAEWREKAKALIMYGAAMKGGKVMDITWYLTSLVITLDPDLTEVPEYSGGPEIVMDEEPGPPEYLHPENPYPEDVIPDLEGEYIWERDVAAQDDRERRNILPLEDGEEDDGLEQELELKKSVPGIFLDQETREDAASFSTEEIEDIEQGPREKKTALNLFLDSNKISTVAKGIIDALEDEEEELEVLDRHEVILTMPSSNQVIDTQTRFDEYVGQGVIVETQDPWESNRVLRGTLLERNSMDVIINKRGRMVTIPLNFVKCVRPAILPEEEDENMDPNFMIDGDADKKDA